MKKKFNAFDIIGLGVISYLICIIFGLVSKHVFNFGDVDILSSSATLFAGIVALVLFNDWREQYHVSSIEKKQLEINNLCDLLFENYISMISFTVRNKNTDVNDADDSNLTLFSLMEHVQRLDNTAFKLRVAFSDYIRIVSGLGECSKQHVKQIIKYDGFVITLQSFVAALGGINNTKKMEQIYKLHFDQLLPKDLNVLWTSCKGEMQGFLISLLKNLKGH